MDLLKESKRVKIRAVKTKPNNEYTPVEFTTLTENLFCC